MRPIIIKLRRYVDKNNAENNKQICIAKQLIRLAHFQPLGMCAKKKHKNTTGNRLRFPLNTWILWAISIKLHCMCTQIASSLYVRQIKLWRISWPDVCLCINKHIFHGFLSADFVDHKISHELQLNCPVYNRHRYTYSLISLYFTSF